MRHAHTEKPNSACSDFERLLTKQGETEAKAAAAFLQGYQIDKILVSYAKRAIQTFKIIQENFDSYDSEIVTELYEDNQEKIFDMIASQKYSDQNILIIGHNPIIHNIALDLSITDSEKYEFLTKTIMPTAGMIILEFPDINTWQDIYTKKGNIIEIFTPQRVLYDPLDIANLN